MINGVKDESRYVIKKKKKLEGRYSSKNKNEKSVAAISRKYNSTHTRNPAIYM